MRAKQSIDEPLRLNIRRDEEVSDLVDETVARRLDVAVNSRLKGHVPWQT